MQLGVVQPGTKRSRSDTWQTGGAQHDGSGYGSGYGEVQSATGTVRLPDVSGSFSGSVSWFQSATGAVRLSACGKVFFMHVPTFQSATGAVRLPDHHRAGQGFLTHRFSPLQAR